MHPRARNDCSLLTVFANSTFVNLMLVFAASILKSILSRTVPYSTTRMDNSLNMTASSLIYEIIFVIYVDLVFEKSSTKSKSAFSFCTSFPSKLKYSRSLLSSYSMIISPSSPYNSFILTKCSFSIALSCRVTSYSLNRYVYWIFRLICSSFLSSSFAFIISFRFLSDSLIIYKHTFTLNLLTVVSEVIIVSISVSSLRFSSSSNLGLNRWSRRDFSLSTNRE